MDPFFSLQRGGPPAVGCFAIDSYASCARVGGSLFQRPSPSFLAAQPARLLLRVAFLLCGEAYLVGCRVSGRAITWRALFWRAGLCVTARCSAKRLRAVSRVLENVRLCLGFADPGYRRPYFARLQHFSQRERVSSLTDRCSVLFQGRPATWPEKVSRGSRPEQGLVSGTKTDDATFIIYARAHALWQLHLLQFNGKVLLA